MRRLTLGCLLGLLALLALAGDAAAQTACTVSPCALQQSKPFTAAAEHQPVDGDTTGYRLYINGAIVQTLAVSARTNILADGTGTIAFPHAGLAKGTHVLYIEAYGDGGATASATVTLAVTPGKPKQPLNIRVITP
jgi:hypothetical protein